MATPASASTTCPSIALSSHTVGGTGAVGGGIGGDIPLAPGDYCNYYRTGQNFKSDSTDQSGLTGFAPALTPLSTYQMGDGSGNVCQSTGAEWGQGVVANNVAANNETCYAVCGVHHYASFNSSNPPINNRPWDAWFGDPALVVTTSAGVHAFTTQGYSLGWGYVCPELRDTTSRWTVEYCVEEWRSNVDTIGPVACGTGAGNNDQAVTPIPSGTGSSDWASKYGPASSDTVDIGWPPSGLPRNGINIAASITATELKAAVSQIQTTCAPSPLSSDPRDYQLIGVEQGHEIAGLSFRSGGTEQDLRLFTTYLVSNATTNSSLPYISGTLAVNSPVTANPGSWSGNVTTYAYQWYRCDKKGANCTTAIPGATRSTYTPGTADAGYPLTVTVAAGSAVSGTTNLAWSSPATSSPSGPVARNTNKRGAAAFRAAAPARVRAQPPGPTGGQLRAMLIRQLAPISPRATSAALRSAGGYNMKFTALVPGTVTISWYAEPKRSQVVAAGRRAIGHAGKGALAITLGDDGRRLLGQGKNLSLTAEGVFTPRGGAPIVATKHFSLRR